MPLRTTSRRSWGTRWPGQVHRYNAVPVSRKEERTRNGIVYDSKSEMQYGAILEQRLRAGEITKIERQIRFELRVNGDLICNHYVDFRITLPDGRVELHEYKGFWEDMYRFKARLLRATYLKFHPEIVYRIIVGKDFHELPQ